jgi:crotonobetainyl-CoA:carnitine CoA-transferase CaiB-like acyl-CoA transferase
MFLVAQHMMQFAVTGKPAAPMPERLSAWAVYDVFDTADGPQVFVGVVTDTQWRTFCEAFGLADLLSDPALATNPLRVNARERFMPRLRAMFAQMSRAEILASCEKVGLPHAPIARPQDMFDDPHLNAPHAMVEVTLADGSKTNTPALPMEFDGRRLGLRLDIPSAGEHGRQIAAEIGLSGTEFDALVSEGVLSVDTTIDGSRNSGQRGDTA